MELHAALLVLGGLFLLGLVADAVGRRTHVPRVTLLLLLGVGFGPAGLGLLPEALEPWYELVATAALTMVAFVLGGSLTTALAAHGRKIIVISLAVVAASVVAVVLGLLATGMPMAPALVLGAIATATAPAATQDVVREAGGSGRFADRLLGIVAIDDAWGLIAFGLMLVAARAFTGAAPGEAAAFTLREIGGAVAVGAAVGLPAALLTGRLRPGEPTQVEALGVVFLCAGLAVWQEVSFLLAGMVAGALVANLARHHERPFHAIENVEWPFLVLFFLLAGASLETRMLHEIGVVGGVYVLARVAGRLVGGYAGGRVAGLPGREGLWTGAALMPQAGVAIGMALVAGNHFPEWRETVLTVTITTTIIFEVAGPFVTRMALDRYADTAEDG